MVGDILTVINAGGGVGIVLLVAFLIAKGQIKVKSEFDAMEARAIRGEERAAVWERRFFEVVGIANRQVSNTTRLVDVVERTPPLSIDDANILELIRILREHGGEKPP